MDIRSIKFIIRDKKNTSLKIIRISLKERGEK